MKYVVDDKKLDAVTFIAVSYTHLDVYKRQVPDAARTRFAAL